MAWAAAAGDCIVVIIANVELSLELCSTLTLDDDDGDANDIVVRIVIRVIIIAKANSNIIRALTAATMVNCQHPVDMVCIAIACISNRKNMSNTYW